MIMKPEGIPLNEGDFVWVEVGIDFLNPRIIGKCRDKDFKSKSDFGEVIFESVNSTGWSYLSVEGNTIKIVNSNSGSIEIKGGVITLNDGGNGGMVNVGPIRTLVQALLADLAVAGSGANLLQWMGTELLKIEDVKSKH